MPYDGMKGEKYSNPSGKKVLGHASAVKKVKTAPESKLSVKAHKGMSYKGYDPKAFDYKY